MLHRHPNVLTAQEVAQLKTMAEAIPFTDGSVSNPHYAAKKNLQVDHNDPRSEEPGKLVRAALFRNQEIRDIALPKQMSRPTLVKYKPGMEYGSHVDAAIFPSQPPMRADVSCTVFVSDPDEYEGGELVVETGAGDVLIKGAAGEAVTYPSTTVHHVNPVTKGERLVSIMWFQSLVRDADKREIFFQLQQINNALYVENRDQPALIIVEAIRVNLMRMWAEL